MPSYPLKLSTLMFFTSILFSAQSRVSPNGSILGYNTVLNTFISMSTYRVGSNFPSPFSPAKPTLVVLKLNYFSVNEGFSSVVLPSLKTLHLNNINLPGLRDLILFLTGCPILEDLFTRCVFVSDETFEDESVTCNEWKGSFLTNLARADIDCFYQYFPLKAVYNVQSLRFEFHQGYYHDDLIPTFHHLTQLKLICYDYTKNFLVDVLNHCPKLQRFDLDEIDKDEEVCDSRDDKFYWVFPDVVPQCIALHLKTCNLLSFLGLQGELMLVRYILKNARVLQTMKIWNSGKPEIKRILSEFPRASATCKLTIIKKEEGPTR